MITCSISVMHKLNPFVSLVVVLVASANSQAAYIRVPVPNHSFELPGTSKQQCWDGEKPGSADIPGWSSDVVAINSGVESEPGSTNGNWIAFLMGNKQDNGDPSIWNLLPYVIKNGDEFILTVDARNNCDAAVLKMSFYYQDDDGQRITVATKTVELTGSFKTYFLRFAADNVPDSVGHELGIELDNPSTGWLGIDNVQIPQSNVPNSVGRALSIESNNSLMFGAKGISASGSVSASPVIIPEPSTIVLFLFGGLILMLKRH
jgi:hypothetical protein